MKTWCLMVIGTFQSLLVLIGFEGWRDGVMAYMSCRGPGSCDHVLGQGCYKLYEGCHMGECMCDPRHQKLNEYGKCVPSKLGRDSCHVKADCPKKMTCRSGRCQCDNHYDVMTDDKLHCLEPGTALLGQRCQIGYKCFQKSEGRYISLEVECSATLGYCVCAEGFKEDGYTCRRRFVEEYGCVKNMHCEGGAMCKEGQCQCPKGYRTVAGISKCVKEGAILNLPSGSLCNEVDEERYCAKSLVCHKCAGVEDFKCVKFLLETEYAFLSGRSSASRHRNFQVTLTYLPLILPLLLQLVYSQFYHHSTLLMLLNYTEDIVR